MIHRYIFHNDRIVPIEESRLSPGQAGLTNGWGLFTTTRIFQGEAFAYERHWRHALKKMRGGYACPCFLSIRCKCGGNFVNCWPRIK